MHSRIYCFRAILICLLAAYLGIVNCKVDVYATEGEQESVVKDQVTSIESSGAIIDIQSYSIKSGTIEAGENAEIQLNLHNVSSTSKASGVIMTISSKSNMIYPAFGSSNQIYIGTMSADGTNTVTVPVAVNSLFEGEYVDLICDFNYQSNGRPLNNSVTIVLPTASGAELYVQSIGLGAKAIVNSDSLLSISYSNQSKKNIDDAVLIINGNVTEDSRRIVLGSIYAGKSYMKDYHITFSVVGQQNINVVLSYTNSNGESVTTDLGNYSVMVSEQSMTEQTGNGISPTIVWVGRVVALVALLIAVVAILVYIKKR